MDTVVVASDSTAAGTAATTRSPVRDRILDVVVELLEAEGYDAVQLRDVARRARVSLATIYKYYETRNELLLAAIERWLDNHRYAGVAEQHHGPGESIYDGLLRLMRTIFEPWERHPRMLEAYFRVRTGPGGERLIQRGFDVVVPAARSVLAGVDEDFVQDQGAILANLTYAMMGRCAQGEIQPAEIMPTIERALYWLTAGYEATRGSTVRRRE